MPFDPCFEGLATPSHPTIRQYGSLGAVLATWAFLDVAVELAISELVQSPLVLGQALSEDLSADNRLKAIKRLLKTWRKRRLDDHHIQAVRDLEEAVAFIATHKVFRNQVAHWLWYRHDDEKLWGFK